MKFPRILIKALIASTLLTNCNNSDETNIQSDDLTTITPNSVNKREVTMKFIDLMKNQNFKNKTISLLENQKPSIPLSKVLNETSEFVGQQQSYTKLVSETTKLETFLENEAPEKIEILEVWMHNSNETTDFSNVLFSFAPEGEEKDWSKIEAYTINKELVYLDAKNPPNQPVIVIETDGFETLKKEVELMNKQLRLEGVQNSRFDQKNSNSNLLASRNQGLETTKLNKIRLNDDEEPWISGAAEIYAITSGIKDSDNSPEIKVIPMYYLDHDDTDYYPNQILLFWDDYKYQAANIQLFEKDDNVNYKDLTSTIVNGVFQIIGTISTQPWVNALGQVAGAIIQAMPDQWYTNNDDYVDSFYTIEKNKSYTNHYGARGNAKVNLAPFFVAAN
ncbi:DUF3103 family protein [uncultured Tenacibaculum sp.]|uniref:DUF3103 family protein n=1 Tax=uncultured Tenacibaculum sp. TaxID=174713 RepID=UPI002610E679|nr:DUF3103 family protein [uncultured Tenacibaculum sp.]